MALQLTWTWKIFGLSFVDCVKTTVESYVYLKYILGDHRFMWKQEKIKNVIPPSPLIYIFTLKVLSFAFFCIPTGWSIKNNHKQQWLQVSCCFISATSVFGFWRFIATFSSALLVTDHCCCCCWGRGETEPSTWWVIGQSTVRNMLLCFGESG